MIPVVALVGRPNVGKSTLFNRLTRSRLALVDDQPGVTRDRLYAEVVRGSRKFLLIDTGGLSESDDPLTSAVRDQVLQALAEASSVVFVVDSRDGLTAADLQIAADLRKEGAVVQVAVNKAEGVDHSLATSEFAELSIGQVFAISAKTGQGVENLLENIFTHAPASLDTESTMAGSRIAVVGRPNVGKSTLVNCLAGEDRVIVADYPGTTRDSIPVTIERDDSRLTLIDTAGVRRKARVRETLEKFSVVKTLQALASAEVAVLMLDAQAGILDQDTAIAGLALQGGRSIVLAINKWDGLDRSERNRIRREIDRRFDFLPNHEEVFISALHGSGMGELLKAVRSTQASAMKEMGTGELNRILSRALEHHSPPMSQNRTIKPKYAHQGGRNPPTVVLHGNSLDKLPASYLRYLSRFIARSFKMTGTQVRFELKKSDNPYNPSPDKRAGRRPTRRS